MKRRVLCEVVADRKDGEVGEGGVAEAQDLEGRGGVLAKGVHEGDNAISEAAL